MLSWGQEKRQGRENREKGSRLWEFTHRNICCLLGYVPAILPVFTFYFQQRYTYPNGIHSPHSTYGLQATCECSPMDYETCHHSYSQTDWVTFSKGKRLINDRHRIRNLLSPTQTLKWYSWHHTLPWTHQSNLFTQTFACVLHRCQWPKVLKLCPSRHTNRQLCCPTRQAKGHSQPPECLCTVTSRRQPLRTT